MQISKGEILFRQGELGDLYHLKTGLLKVVRSDTEGNHVLLNILIPGEVFPHHSLISPKHYHATVSALIPSKVEQLPAYQWYQSLSENPEKYKEVASILQENLRKMQQRLDMVTSPRKKRISFFQQWLSFHCRDYPMEEILTQEEIGQFLGMSRETVNRHIRGR